MIKETSKKSEEKEQDKEIAKRMGRIGKKIAVMSGKGGVGKSSVTALIALHFAKKGYKVGIFDTDFLGPSIPKLFGLEWERLAFSEDGIEPVKSARYGIKILSIHFMLPQKNQPVIWRGPMISRVIMDFLSKVSWGDLDYLLFDLPPGTGDVPLTVMQSVKLDGMVMVTTPQELTAEIVEKGVNMALRSEANKLYLVENMSFFKCPECGKINQIFGKGKTDELARKYGFKVVAKIPLNPNLTELCDRGKIEDFEEDYFDGLKF
jgi:Mrp family chromosome partitioning ATPase